MPWRETARVHHAARRRSGSVAVAAQAQPVKSPIIGVLGAAHLGHGPMDRWFCAALRELG